MAYHFYFDLTLTSTRRGGQNFDKMGELIHQMHRAHMRSNVDFAIAFPQWMQNGYGFGAKLRVWSESESGINALYDAWDAIEEATDLAEGGRVRTVQAAAIQGYESYVMQRLPSGISKRETDLPRALRKELQARARVRRIAQQSVLPFVRMISSTGHRFRLVIDRVAAAPSEGARPNGYGLSRKNHMVALPVITP